jgi:hypothetical protein
MLAWRQICAAYTAQVQLSCMHVAAGTGCRHSGHLLDTCVFALLLLSCFLMVCASWRLVDALMSGLKERNSMRQHQEMWEATGQVSRECCYNAPTTQLTMYIEVMPAEAAH